MTIIIIITQRSPLSPDLTAPVCSRLRHIVEEMVTTEREYVRSLRYIIHHYFPEMERADLPQGLRGKRSVIFGNLEKLLDFHSQFFLKELEACWKHPLRVPHSFLRHVGLTSFVLLLFTCRRLLTHLIWTASIRFQ